MAKLSQEIKDLETIIEKWFDKHFRNSRLSQNVEVYNKLQAAKDDLKVQVGVAAPAADPAPINQTTSGE